MVVGPAFDENRPVTMLYTALVQAKPARALGPRTASHRRVHRPRGSGEGAPGLTQTRLSYPHNVTGGRDTNVVTPVKGQVQLSAGSIGEPGDKEKHLP